MTKCTLCLTKNLAFFSTEPFTTGYIPLKYISYFNYYNDELYIPLKHCYLVTKLHSIMS